MQQYLLEMLQCPLCGHELEWHITEAEGSHIESGRALCTDCSADYPIQEGIGLFLTPDLPRKDLWEGSGGGLETYLDQNPEIEVNLVGVPIEILNPADQFFRAMALEERKQYTSAKNAEQTALSGLHTPETLACWEALIGLTIEMVSARGGPVVDLASGRGYLVEKMAALFELPVVATDFSPRVLRRDRRWFEFFGLYDHISLLAFDARRTPFKNGAVNTLTTNLGLPNIEQPGELLKELRRITGGTFLAITQFYPPEDHETAAALADSGLSDLIYREPTMEGFAQAGWQVEISKRCNALARPTPKGEVIKDAVIDNFPIKPTELEWCLLEAC